MMRSLLLFLFAVALVAATDAASAAPRGRVGGVATPNSAVHAQPNGPSITSRGTKSQGQVRSQLMYSVGHINGEPSKTKLPTSYQLKVPKRVD